jgi:DNA-binding NarL/FixJ family response regulator
VLSQRDRVLLEHLARGDSVRQIAVALSVSRNTARTRVRRVAAKLAVPDRGRLVLAARDLVPI